jgi:hypothetical protein
MDDKALRASHFIRISRRLTGRGARYYWVFADMPERELPIHASISFGDDKTWRIEYLMGAPADIPARRPSAPPTDVSMQDILSTSTPPPPGASHGTHSNSFGYVVPDLYMQDILQNL